MSNENEIAKTNVQTHEHIMLIRNLIGHAITELLRRAEKHDQSKFSPTEIDTFVEFTPKLKNSTYGSDEYKGFLAQMKPALDHHYRHNRHHPEFFANGIEGMNLIDLLEMYIDWLASGKRHADGDINRSIDVQEKRFGMSPQLVAIFRNTARDFTVDGVTNPYVSEKP